LKYVLHKPNTIWIDGDSCPKAIKEIVFKTSLRLNLETAVRDAKLAQDLELESLCSGAGHSQVVKDRPTENDSGSRDCVKLASPTAVSRLNINIIIVANSYQNIPKSDLIKMMVVDKGFDVADQHIIDRVEVYDIVVTADIPLAAKILKKKAIGLNPRGEIYNENNICSILSMRDFLKEFRDAGSITSGPAAFGPKDIKQFADSLNKLVS